jgi:hypothetical protein
VTPLEAMRQARAAAYTESLALRALCPPVTVTELTVRSEHVARQADRAHVDPPRHMDVLGTTVDEGQPAAEAVRI